MPVPQYASEKDMAVMAAEHDVWLRDVDTSHIKPLDESWEDHPFWADARDIQDPSTAAGKAVQAMQNEFTADERAESCKDSGNQLLKQGRELRKKHVIGQAVEKYTEGLRIVQASSDPVSAVLRTALYSNRALAESLLGNWRNALDSAQWAVKTDPQHVKSYFRAAQAAQKLKRWQVAEDMCQQGLAVEPGAQELRRILQACQEDAQQERAQQAAEAEARERRLAPMRATAQALLARGYRMTRPQFGFQKASSAALPWLDGNNVLRFPVLLFYPEANPYHDTIEDCSEEDCVGDHITQMFSAEAPALPWDTAGEYQAGKICLYYCSHAGTILKQDQIVDALQQQYPKNYVEVGVRQIGERKSTMQAICMDWTFAQLLQRHDHVMPGCPVLWVLCKGSAFHDTFLDRFDIAGT